MAYTVKLGFLTFLAVLLTLRQQHQHRFWNDWDDRFKRECAKRDSTAESIPFLVMEMKKIRRREVGAPGYPRYQGIFRLLDERKKIHLRDTFFGFLLLCAFCLNIFWLFRPFLTWEVD